MMLNKPLDFLLYHAEEKMSLICMLTFSVQLHIIFYYFIFRQDRKFQQTIL